MNPKLRLAANFLYICAGTGALTFGYKAWFQGDFYKGKESMLGRTVIVTGPTSGIGKHLATSLAKRGASVILGCRDMNTCEDVRSLMMKDAMNRDISCAGVDLSDQDSVLRFVDGIKTPVDVVVLNAGIKFMESTKKVSKQLVEINLAVNFIGNYLLVNRLLDAGKIKSKGRIVGVVCGDAWDGEVKWTDINSTDYFPLKAYKQSKLAEAMFLMELNTKLRMKQSDITVNLVDPLNTYTKLHRTMPYNNFILSRLMFETYNFVRFRQPWQASQTIIYAVMSKDLEGQTGKLFCDFEETILPEALLDSVACKRVWLLGEKWTSRTKTS